ncbi:MAG: hypothetical protein KDK99_11560, partial [Verrucomicrobiales bacterium]|nr:hypothetical protein [Verrucomicrobiales bacterium]
VNLIIANNLFINNTTKDESDLRRGRISWRTGEPVQFPELYFTVYEDDGHYGPVIVRDNIFQVGDAVPEEAVTFAPGGHDLEMTNNVFSGRPITIVCDPANEAVRIENNRGAKLEKKALDPDHGRR